MLCCKLVYAICIQRDRDVNFLSADASKCLEGFAEAGSLPVNTATSNPSFYKVLPSGIHLFPGVKFLCDGSVRSLEIGLFYTTHVKKWEEVVRAELLFLSSAGNYRECSYKTLNCLKMDQNLTNSQLASQNTTIAHVFHGCGRECVKFQNSTILTISQTFKTQRTVKRGDYLGLVVPPRERKFEDALPIIYTGNEYEDPFVAIPPGSFSPSGESNSCDECYVLYVNSL